jgi:transcriptional regulator with XRE-family HTH domain
MEIGKAIKEIRSEKGISQNKLSKLTGLNRGYLYKLENDLISPSLDIIEKIALYLEVPVSDLVKRTEKPI